MFASVGADADDGMSLQVSTAAGQTICLSKVPLSTRLDSLAECLVEHLSVPVDDIRLSVGDAPPFDVRHRMMTLSELGMPDGAHLNCIILPSELLVDENVFRCPPFASDSILAPFAKNSYIEDYRLRRRSTAFAEDAAIARENVRRALEASLCVMPEASDPMLVYESQRRTVEFAIRAAAEREERLQELLVPASYSGVINVRQAVGFAIQAMEERNEKWKDMALRRRLIAMLAWSTRRDDRHESLLGKKEWLRIRLRWEWNERPVWCSGYDSLVDFAQSLESGRTTCDLFACNGMWTPSGNQTVSVSLTSNRLSWLGPSMEVLATDWLIHDCKTVCVVHRGESGEADKLMEGKLDDDGTSILFADGDTWKRWSFRPAKDDFDGARLGSEYLSFKRGEHVYVSPNLLQGWAFGRCNTRLGWYPPEHV